MSLPAVLFGYYQDVFKEDPMSRDMPFLPYVLNYFSMFLVSYPLIKITSTINLKQLFLRPVVNTVVNTYLIMCVVLSVLSFLVLLMYGDMGFADRYMKFAHEGTGYNFSDLHPLIGVMASIMMLIYNVLYPLVFSCLIFRLVNNKIRFQGFLLLCVLIHLPRLLSAYTIGSRNGLFFIVIGISFFVIIFWNQINIKYRIKLRKAALVFMIPTILLASAISSDRFQNSDEGGFGSMIRYFGEAFPNLDCLYWNQVTNHTYGARMFSDYVTFLTGAKAEQLDGFGERFDFWSSYTGVPAANFKTFYGDLYVEFNEYGALVFVLLFFVFEWILFSVIKFSLSSIPIYFVFFSFCTNMIIDIPMAYTTTYYFVIFNLMIVVYFVHEKFLSYEK